MTRRTLSILLASCCVEAQNTNRVLRVLTYNIHHGEGMDGKIDLKRIAAVIRSVDPDFVAVQEVDVRTRRSNGVDQAAVLAKLANMHGVFARTIDHQGGWYGNVLLSRWPLQGMIRHEMPVTPGREQRGILEGIVASTPEPIRFFATHFDITEKDRIAAVEALAGIAGAGDAMILAGDLNAAPGSRPIRGLIENGWSPAVSPDNPARPLLTSPAEQPKTQIDWVLFRPQNRWKVVEVRVLDEAMASDHRPLLVVLELLPR